MKKIVLISGALLVCAILTGTLLWRVAGRNVSAENRPAPAEDAGISEELLNEPIRPIPLKLSLDPRKVSLGDKLFHDAVLSRDNSVSCKTCHDLAKGGVDGLKHSVGINGAVGAINAPTVFNAGFNFSQFWDGRSDTLEDQVNGPLTHPAEMGSEWEAVLKKLKASPEYSAAFSAAYSEGVTKENVRHSIATFERSLYTPNCRFDRYLRGDANAITEDEKEGYRLFKTLGCTTCHQGMAVGGNMFQPFGIMGNYFADRGGDLTKADLGRFNVTGIESDKHKFKVPSLRNVELTAPYFHDGSAKTLEDAVSVMTRYQLGVTLREEKIALIVKFLKTLTGEAVSKR